MNLKEIDALLFATRAKLDYQKYMTPINYAEENEKFLRLYGEGVVYNPQYEYEKFSPQKDDLDAVRLCVEETAAAEGGIALLLNRSAESLLKEMELYSLIGDNEAFTPLSNSIFGRPSETLREEALGILTKKAEEDCETKFPALMLASFLKERIAEYGFSWDIQLSPKMASRVSVEPEQKTVYINAAKTFTERDITRLAVHEIDTHVLRCENGERQGYHLLSSGTVGSLIHEEGLAIFSEWKNGVQDRFAEKLYAARYLTCLDIDLPFYELFDRLIWLGVDKEQALYVVARIKRGLSDTSLPGGFIKDYVYFGGFYEVRDFLARHPEKTPYLYYGSVALGDLEVLDADIKAALDNGSIILPIEKQ